MGRFRIQAAGAAFLAAATGLHVIVTPDLWWHLASGRWILEHRVVPVTDVFTYTVADHEWTNLQWLTDVLLALAWRAVGPDGLVLAKAICLAATAALLVFVARAAGAGAAAAGIAVGLGALAAAERTMVRPEILSGVAFAAGLLLIYRARAGRRRAALFLPGVTVVWANLHALAFLLPLTTLLHAALAAMDERLPDRWRAGEASPGAARDLGIAGLVSAVALLGNPYGVAAWTFPLTLFERIGGGLDVFSRILEFGPLPADPGHPGLRFAWVFLAAVALSFVACWPRFPATRLAAVVPFVLLAFLARRNVPFLVAAAAPILAANLTEAAGRFPGGWFKRLPAGLVPGAALLVGLAILAGVSPRLLGHGRDRGLFVAPGLFPEQSLSVLDATGRRGPLFNDLDFGGYVVWRDPGRKTFIDGRLEVAGPEWLARYVEAHENPASWERMCASWNIRILLLQHHAAGNAALLSALLSSGNWMPLHYSPEAALLVAREADARPPPPARPGSADWDRILREDRGPAPGGGRALAFLGEPLHRALDRAPHRARVRRASAFANLCLTIGWIPEARAGYEKVIAVSPDDAPALFNLGICDLREGRPDRARDRWEAALPRVAKRDRAAFETALRELRE